MGLGVFFGVPRFPSAAVCAFGRDDLALEPDEDCGSWVDDETVGCTGGAGGYDDLAGATGA